MKIPVKSKKQTGCVMFVFAHKGFSDALYREGGGKMRRGKNCETKRKLSLILFAAALLCLCFLSAKLTLVLLALSLIALGIWLMKC